MEIRLSVFSASEFLARTVSSLLLCCCFVLLVLLVMDLYLDFLKPYLVALLIKKNEPLKSKPSSLPEYPY